MYFFLHLKNENGAIADEELQLLLSLIFKNNLRD